MLNRRSTFLINKRFQLRFAFYVCSWLIALSFAYPLIISNLFDYFMRYLAADPNGPSVAILETTRQDFLRMLIAMQLIFLSITFLISIFMSHRIAGPLYKLGRFFENAKSGQIDQNLVFRKKDYFQEIATSYNEMMTAIRGRIQENQDCIAVAIPRIEKALSKAPPEIRGELESALSTLKSGQNH